MKKVRLKDVAEIMYGYTAKSGIDKQGPKYLRITDIQDSRVQWSAVPNCEIGQLDMEKYRLQPGDIVFARTGATTGKSFLIQDPPAAVFASYLIRVKTTDKRIDQRFLHFYFQSQEYWEAIRQGTTGSAQGGFNASKLGALVIPLPPLPEQKRIVAILDQAFEAIGQAQANIERTIGNVKELWQSRLVQILSTKNGSWKSCTLQDVCEKITDGTHQTPKYFDSGVIFLSSKNVTSGRIDWNNVKYIDEAQHQQMHKRVAPRPKDILLAKNGTTGVAAMVDRDEVFDIYVSLAHIRSLGEVLPEYMLHYINSPLAKKQFNKRLKGIGVPNLHLKEIREVEISYPESQMEQQSVVDSLEVFQEKVRELSEAQQEKLKALSELRKSILHQAFSGELTEKEVVV